MARPEGWLLILLIVGFILLSAKWLRPSPVTVRVEPKAKPTPRPLKLRTPDDCPACCITPVLATGSIRRYQPLGRPDVGMVKPVQYRQGDNFASGPSDRRSRRRRQRDQCPSGRGR